MRYQGIEHVDIQDQQSAKPSNEAPSNPGRRRFASVGAKASGVVLTLVSQPGMATTALSCKTPSGFMSNGPHSSPGNNTLVCGGKSPGYWKNWPESWPKGIWPTARTTYPKHEATTFASVFPSGWTQLYQTGTLMEVLTNNNSASDPSNLGFHLVAAYLNVMSGKTNVFTVQRLKLIWHDLYTYGYYMPNGTTRWYARDVAAYLKSTET